MWAIVVVRHENHFYEAIELKTFHIVNSVGGEHELNDIFVGRYKLINKYQLKLKTKINTFNNIRVEKPHARFICIGSGASSL